MLFQLLRVHDYGLRVQLSLCLIHPILLRVTTAPIVKLWLDIECLLIMMPMVRLFNRGT